MQTYGFIFVVDREFVERCVSAVGFECGDYRSANGYVARIGRVNRVGMYDEVDFILGIGFAFDFVDGGVDFDERQIFIELGVHRSDLMLRAVIVHHNVVVAENERRGGNEFCDHLFGSAVRALA